MNSITSANSIFYLVVAGLFPAPVKIEGYSSDKAFATEGLPLAETSMGVDGRLSAGYTPSSTKQTVSLQADSPSRSLFAAIVQATKTAKEVYWLSGTIALPATGESFALTRGVLTVTKQLPDANKVLQPVEFTIEWESVDRSLL